MMLGRTELGRLSRFFKLRFAILSLALLGAVGIWLVLADCRDGSAVTARAHAPAQGSGADARGANDRLTAEAITAEQPTPLDKLRISSQTWRRGGLGSNALITFTIRNNNDYAVKDIEIACAFARGDGSHLTDRTRLLPGTIDMRSRKIFAHLHVGFVNINANRAKCAVVSASRA